jgi:hypothetical protein
MEPAQHRYGEVQRDGEEHVCSYWRVKRGEGQLDLQGDRELAAPREGRRKIRAMRPGAGWVATGAMGLPSEERVRRSPARHAVGNRNRHARLRVSLRPCRARPNRTAAG